MNALTICIGGCSNNIETLARQAGLDGVIVTRDSEKRLRRNYDATVQKIAEDFANSEMLEPLFYSSLEMSAIPGEFVGKRGALYSCIDLLEIWADGKVVAHHFNDDDVVVASETFLYVSEATHAQLTATLSKIEEGDKFRHSFEIATENRNNAAA